MRKTAALFIFLLFLPSLVFAATLHGTAYDSTTLDPLSGTIITVNSTPPQTMVADPDYSLELAPGTYLFNATYYSNGFPELQLIEIIRIEYEGTFVLDLLLQPVSEDIPAAPQLNSDLELPTADWTGGLASLFLLFAVLAFLVFKLRRRPPSRKPPSPPQRAAPEHPELPSDLRTALLILKQHGGRMTQKDLRSRLKHSEAKVSLMLDDLENRGLIKRFKKGRGNVIRLTS